MSFLSWVLGRSRGEQESGPIVLPPRTYVELKGPNGDTNGVLISHDEDARNILLNAIQVNNDKAGCVHGGRVGSFLAERLGQATAVGISAFSSTGLYQIVASPEVIRGLAGGSLQHVIGKSGLLSMVKDGATNKFASHVAFSPASMASIVAPVVVWQVIHTVFAVRELSKINERLDSLQRGIGKLIRHSQARTFGCLAASMRTLQELSHQQGVMGRFSEDMRQRLIVSSRDIRVSLLELELKLRDVHQRVESLKGKSGKEGAHLINKFMQENTDFLPDAQLFVMACQASIAASESWIRHDLEFNPEYVWRRCEQANEEVEEARSAAILTGCFSELQSNAERCIEQMGTWERFWNSGWLSSGLVDEIRSRGKALPIIDAPVVQPSQAPSIFIWKEANGQIITVADKPLTELPPPQ